MGAQELGRPARDQRRSEDGPERAGRDARPGAAGDRPSGHVRLLGGEPSLLDREGGHVARGPDALEARHVHLHVRRQEAPRAARQPGDGRDGEVRKGDGMLAGDRLPRLDLERSVAMSEGTDPGTQADTGLGEPGVDQLGDIAPEGLQRPRLVCHHDDLHADQAARPNLGGGQHRELVRGNRPRRGRRHDEGDALPPGAADPLQHPVESRATRLAPEVEGPVDGVARLGAQRDQKRVVRKLDAGRRSDHPVLRAYIRERVATQPRPGQ